MANRAAEIRATVQSQSPGAVVTARGRNWIEHALVDGRRVLDAGLGPLHVAGTETEIDTAWRATTGAWQYQMVLADYNAYARSQLNAGDTVQYRDPGSGETVTFQPLALNWVNEVGSRQQITQPQSVMATVADDVLRWQNGYGAGRHFRWQAQSARLQKLLTIDSAANLPAPAAWLTGTRWLELEFIVKFSAGIDPWLDGVKWSRGTTPVRTANRVEFRSIASGAALWHLDYPRAWDSAGNEVVGQYELRRQSSSYYITVRVPQAWLQSAVYPVYIDPTIEVSVSAGSNDGHWWEGTTDFDADSSYMLVGNGNQWGRGAMNGFARFVGLAGLQGMTVDSAYLRYTANESFSTATCRIRIRAVAADNPAAPTSYAQAEGATRTTAYVDWSVPADVNNVAKNSPDIAAVVQEVVNRSGFGGALIVYLEDNASDNNARRYVGPYDWSATNAPLLHIEYSEGLPEGISASVTQMVPTFSMSSTGRVGARGSVASIIRRPGASSAAAPRVTGFAQGTMQIVATSKAVQVRANGSRAVVLTRPANTNMAATRVHVSAAPGSVQRMNTSAAAQVAAGGSRTTVFQIQTLAGGGVQIRGSAEAVLRFVLAAAGTVGEPGETITGQIHRVLEKLDTSYRVQLGAPALTNQAIHASSSSRTAQVKTFGRTTIERVMAEMESTASAGVQVTGWLVEEQGFERDRTMQAGVSGYLAYTIAKLLKAAVARAGAFGPNAQLVLTIVEPVMLAVMEQQETTLHLSESEGQ
jgi:hypothetical protein